MYPDGEFLVASLGTGEYTQPLLYSDAKNWGARQWARPIIGISIDGTSATVDYQMSQLLPETRYFRFQARLNECNDDIDDASPTNIRGLQLLVEHLIAENDQGLDALCQELV